MQNEKKTYFPSFLHGPESFLRMRSAAREQSSTRLPAVTWLTVHRRIPVPVRWRASWQEKSRWTF
eukprot:8573031-Pyramimonas_sp.AAC.1